MKYTFSLFFLLTLSLSVFSQGRIVMNDDGYLVIKNSAFVVIDNNNANALSETGTGGRIISENETNVVRWNISDAMGLYTLPFYDDVHGTEIPVSMNITTAGSAGASNHVDFSTYGGPNYDNLFYMPSDVLNMASAVAGTVNNSSKVVDRFWMLDVNHTTKPDVTLSLSYSDIEWNAPGNIITEGNLAAQRWNSDLNDWDPLGLPPTGICNTATNVVSGISFTGSEFYKSWTLVDNTTPLPIELISNETQCSNNHLVFKWSTATETNNDYFTIEKSLDGVNFVTAGTVDGAGNSTSIKNYSFTDFNSYAGSSYYRLSQTDYNGERKTFPVVSAKDCSSYAVEVNAYNNQNGSIVIVLDAAAVNNYSAVLYDAQGNRVKAQDFESVKGNNNFKLDVSNCQLGVYFLQINNGGEQVSKKIFIN